VRVKKYRRNPGIVPRVGRSDRVDDWRMRNRRGHTFLIEPGNPASLAHRLQTEGSATTFDDQRQDGTGNVSLVRKLGLPDDNRARDNARVQLCWDHQKTGIGAGVEFAENLYLGRISNCPIRRNM